MNKNRLQRLRDAVEKISAAYSELDKVRNEERDAFDCMPENLQYSERGEQTEQNADDLDDALSYIEDGMDALNDIIANN